MTTRPWGPRRYSAQRAVPRSRRQADYHKRSSMAEVTAIGHRDGMVKTTHRPAARGICTSPGPGGAGPRHDPGGLLIAAADSGEGVSHQLPSAGLDPDEHGRGMHIVCSLAQWTAHHSDKGPGPCGTARIGHGKTPPVNTRDVPTAQSHPGYMAVSAGTEPAAHRGRRSRTHQATDGNRPGHGQPAQDRPLWGRSAMRCAVLERPRVTHELGETGE
jgi:hypothetical protein